LKYWLSLALLLLLFGAASADTLSVAVNKAPIYNKPISPGYVVLEVPLYYPLLVVKEQGDFYRVKDYRGRSGWIRKEHLNDNETIVIRGNQVNIRNGPGLDHPIVLKGHAGVALRVIGEKEDWLEVQHESGLKGWIAESLTWGR